MVPASDAPSKESQGVILAASSSNRLRTVTRSRSRSVAIGMVALVVIAALVAFPIAGQSAGARFFASLRLAKPKPDTAGAALNAPLNGGRRLEDVFAAIVAESTVTTRDEANVTAANAD